MLRYLLFGLLSASILCFKFSSAAVVTNATSVSPLAREWKTLTTPHFKIHFTPEQEKWAYYAANVAEATHNKLSKELDWVPGEPTNMVLSDNYDRSNGWATAIPFQNVRLFLSPPDNLNTLEDYDDWLKLLIVHEYTHVLHFDKAGGFHKVMRKIFGRGALFFPNAWQPKWMIEGLATHNETDEKAGYGRGQSSNYNMRMRSEVLHGIKDIQTINVHDREWPADSAYLYGTYFMAFITEKYGAEALDKYIDYYSRNVIPFWLNPTARRTFDKDFLQLWDAFKVALHNKFDPQLARIKQQGIHQGNATAVESQSAASGEFYDGSYYFIQSCRRQPTMLKRLDAKGKLEPIARLYQKGLFDINQRGEIVVAQVRANSDNRFYSDLYLFNSDNDGKLTEQQRWREARWMDSQHLLARRITNGLSELAMLDREGQLLESLWQGDYGETLGQFDYQPQRNLLVAQLKKPGLDWDIYQFDFEQKQWQPLLSHQGIEAEPQFSANGQTLLFTADYDGDFNSYQFDLISKQIVRLSRTDTGVFSPTLIGSRLYNFRYGAKGYQLRQTDRSLAEPVTPETQLSSDYVYDFSNKSEYSTSSYGAWDSLRPHSWFPIVFATESYSLLGVGTSGNDALGKHTYSADVAVDPKFGEVQANISYLYSNKLLTRVYRDLSYTTQEQDVLRITAENGTDLVWMNVFSGLDSKYTSHIGVNWSRYTTVEDAFDLYDDSVFESAIAGISFVYDDRESYVDNAGFAWGDRLVFKVGSFDIVDDDLKGEIASFHWSHQWGFENGHVLSLKTEAGYSHASWSNGKDFNFNLGDKQSSVSPFYFDPDNFNLRGFNSNQFKGYRVQTNSLEWTMPLMHIERSLGMYPIGLQDEFVTLFVDSGAAWNRELGGAAANLGNDFYGKYHTGVGAELLVELNLGYRAVIPLTFGYAKGLGDYGEHKYYLNFNYSF